MDFLTGKISYACRAIPDLFGYWEVYLISLPVKFKSALPATLSNIEGSLSIFTHFFTLPRNPCNPLTHTQNFVDARSFT